jgi:excisionase family DNA binding protein
MKSAEKDVLEVTERKLLSIEQARHQLGGISRSTVYELINSGDLQRVKLGGRAFIPQASIDHFVDKLSEA